MVEVMKNMFRRKTRTLLTIFGITIGIFAFVVMGSMAEKINLLVNGGTKYYRDKVTITEGTSTLGSYGPMNYALKSKIGQVPGVAAVSAYALVPFETSAVSFGPGPLIIGTDFAGQNYETFKISYSKGRPLSAADTGKVVVGSDLVKKLDAKVGQDITVLGKRYEVVGIMNKTLTAPDSEVNMTLPDAQKLLYDKAPQIIRSSTRPGQLVNSFTVYPTAGTDPNRLADRINREVPGVKASGPKVFQEQIATATGIFNSILFGVALISLLVGGLSIINTMTMSISERIREIGIKKAVGARTRTIMREYLTEAGLIGLFGGIIGWAAGALLITLVNKSMSDSGNVIFLLSPRITVAAIVFSVLLGTLAGIVPARHAVKISIVKALRGN